jgi:hypothetical protein
MFSESSPPLPWDDKHAYTRDAVELYYQVRVYELNFLETNYLPAF